MRIEEYQSLPIQDITSEEPERIFEFVFEDEQNQGQLRFSHPEDPDQILEINVSRNTNYFEVADIVRHPKNDPVPLSYFEEIFQEKEQDKLPKYDRVVHSLRKLDEKLNDVGLYIHRKKNEFGIKYAYVSTEKPVSIQNKMLRKRENEWDTLEDDPLKSRIREMIGEEGGASQDALLSLFDDKNSFRRKVKMKGKIRQIKDEYAAEDTGLTITQKEIEQEDGTTETYFTLDITDTSS